MTNLNDLTQKEKELLNLALRAYATTTYQRGHELKAEKEAGKYVEPRWIVDCTCTCNEVKALYGKLFKEHKT